MADFEYRKSDRFPGDFILAIAAGYEASQDEVHYVERINVLLARLAEADVSDPGLAAELVRTRSECAEDLLRRARRLGDQTRGEDRNQLARREIEASHRLEGIHLDRRSRILEIPFLVHTIPPEPTRPIIDIEIRTRDTRIPEEKRAFKVEIDRTATVIKAVLGERRSWWARLRGVRPDPLAQDAARRIDEYLFALFGVAQVGLMNLDASQTPFAKLALEGLQSEFVAREAGTVKNAYVTRLGWSATLAVIVGAVGYIGSALVPPGWVMYRFREFFLLACGSAIGTWLSFSIRRVQLSFFDLATLEEDRLNPGLRILFMIALTTVVGLLLWTQAVVIEIGGFKSAFAKNGAYALLIGALSGIAERGITTAVSKRATDFAAGLGGSTKL